MDKQLLDILVCPMTGAAVTLAKSEVVTRVNARIAAGEQHYADDSVVTLALEAALITSDHSMLYRVDDGIPVMLPELGIALAPE